MQATTEATQPLDLRAEFSQIKTEIESLQKRAKVLSQLSSEDLSKTPASELKTALQAKTEAKNELKVVREAIEKLNARRLEILEDLKLEKELREIEKAKQRVREFQATLPEWAEKLNAAARAHAEIYAEFAKAAKIANDYAMLANPQSAAICVDASQGLRTLDDPRITLIQRIDGRWLVTCPRIAAWLKESK